MSFADCKKGALLLKMLLEFLRPGVPKVRIKVSDDNEAAISLTSNPICTDRMKHIHIRHHSLGNTAEQRRIELVHAS